MPRNRRTPRGLLPASLAVLAALALAGPTAPALTSASAAPAPSVAPSIAPSIAQSMAQRADGDAPVSLWAPKRYETSAYRGRVWSDLGLRLLAETGTFELRSTRAGYDERIRTVWKAPGGDVLLPPGSMSSMGTLRQFLKLTIKPLAGGPTVTRTSGVCFAGYSQRMRPDAPATSPYPDWCAYNPYSLGALQGVQEGWAMPLMGDGRRPLRLSPGRYRVTAQISPRYATPLGLSAADATRVMTLVVRDEDDEGRPEPAHRAGSSRVAQPAAHRPTGPFGRDSVTDRPDLRSLPAWGIGVSENGDFLQFSATVWNAGSGPLVVDGFRREGEDEMDAYQYFFDAEGHQTGYLPVGGFQWDAKRTHQHWHFRDFASYTLLKADKTAIVRSRKEAFCLANTDAVDTTVPGAELRPENTDLATACGDYGSLSIREVLVPGWGDTYAQFRAGQSFSLRGLPNGTYYIEVRANPRGRLHEVSSANNVALRRVVIGGKPGARTVRVPQVGLIVEPSSGDPGEGRG